MRNVLQDERSGKLENPRTCTYHSNLTSCSVSKAVQGRQSTLKQTKDGGVWFNQTINQRLADWIVINQFVWKFMTCAMSMIFMDLVGWIYTKEQETLFLCVYVN